LLGLGQEAVAGILTSYLSSQFAGLKPSKLNKYLRRLKKGVK